LKIFQLFIIRPATLPDQSEPKFSTDGACADFVLFRSAAYFPEWKLTFTGNNLLDRTGKTFDPVRSAAYFPEWKLAFTVVKIESRSFSSAEIQHFRTENMRSDYN
jgi:hypothetical protein